MRLVWPNEPHACHPFQTLRNTPVWDKSKVRDLMDSIYRGYPVGYIITWKNPDMPLKDGTLANSMRILIDGQRRNSPRIRFFREAQVCMA